MLRKKATLMSICLAVSASFLLSGASLAWACVGRKIVIGYRANTEQRILSELLGILIEERTGTKITFKEFDDTMELHRALEANEIQMYVEYTGVGLTEILGSEPISDPKKVYKKVKKEYNKNFNLIWLKAFGFNNHDAEYKELTSAGIPLYAAPLVRKDTLKKFPALSRLLNKLNNKIDNKTMDSLIQEVEKQGKEPKQVASRFLNSIGISFSFSPGVG